MNAAKNPISWKYFPEVENQIQCLFLGFSAVSVSDSRVVVPPFSSEVSSPERDDDDGVPVFACFELGCKALLTLHPKSATSLRFQASHIPKTEPNSKIVAPNHAVQPMLSFAVSKWVGSPNGRKLAKPKGGGDVKSRKLLK